MRIVTRPDFDGIVCAVIILEAKKREIPVVWLEPGLIQSGNADIVTGDIMANLPFDPRCSVWFDHHVSNREKLQSYLSDRNERKIEGSFEIAPSAAGIVYRYYRKKGELERDFDELIKETDIIDSADLSIDQVNHPEKYPYILLSMTVKNRDESDPPYWEKLVGLLREGDISDVLRDKEVSSRCTKVIEENLAYSGILKKYTSIHGSVSVTDFRSFERAPSGNRFLTYSLFSECMASIKVRYDDKDRNTVFLSVGKSIFNDRLNVNIGNMLAKYGGGGHAGAGGCTMSADEAEAYLNEIITILNCNNKEI